tara:strand:+ start:1353 stop:1835 length:483 start_codon:yes stop_codon:yes gene_type:complete
MPLYSYKTEYPTTKIPEMITLSDGSTRTDSSTFTSDELLDAGYVEVSNPPDYDQETHKLVWTGTEWQIISLTESEITAINDRRWQSIRQIREDKIKTVEWRIMRNLSETRQGITTTTDNIADLDAYVQALRDITTSTTNPLEVVWPSLGPSSSDENTPSP